MVKVKCNRCGRKFNEFLFEYIWGQCNYFGTARFICPKCYNQSITKEVKK